MGWIAFQRASSRSELTFLFARGPACFANSLSGTLGALLRVGCLGMLLSAGCSGSDDDELKKGDGGPGGNTDGGNAGGLDGGDGDGDGSSGDGDVAGDGDAPGDGDGDGGDGDGPGTDGGLLVGHPKSCDAPVLAGDPDTTESEDVPELITGPDGQALITWAAPQRTWYARSYDGENFGTIHQLFQNYVSDEQYDGARAAVGYGHGIFLANVVNSTNYQRLWTQASDSWADPVAQTGETISLAVRPTGHFLRVRADGATATLETIDPASGDVETQPLTTIAQSLVFNPRKLIVDSQDRGIFAAGASNAVHAYLLNLGEVVASGTFPVGKYVYDVRTALLADGKAAVAWQTDTEINVAYVEDADDDGAVEWSTPALITNQVGGGLGIVSTPDGELTVVWASGQTFARRYVNGTWGATKTVLDHVTGGEVALAISDAGTVAMMIDPNNNSGTTLNTVLKGEHEWSSLPVSGNSPYRQSLAFNAKGEPYFIWASGEVGGGGRREIMLTTCR